MIINLEILLQNQRIIDHQVKESINSLVVLCGEPNLKQSFDAAIEHASLKQTEIDDTPKEADAFFPEYKQWRLTNVEKHTKDDKHLYDYTFSDYEK